jgi:hypothetical protein
MALALLMYLKIVECGVGTCLARNHADLIPHQARQYVLQERQIEVGFLDFEFGVARVQRERRGVRLAGFDGAGEEVEGEEFHFGGVGWIDSGGACRLSDLWPGRKWW